MSDITIPKLPTGLPFDEAVMFPHLPVDRVICDDSNDYPRPLHNHGRLLTKEEAEYYENMTCEDLNEVLRNQLCLLKKIANKQQT